MDFSLFPVKELWEKEGESASVKLVLERVRKWSLERRAKNSGIGPCKLFTSSWTKGRLSQVEKFMWNYFGQVIAREDEDSKDREI